jgi:hypothetical protein
MFIKPFDDDQDCALNYTEFLFCVLSSSVVYREKVIKRLREKDLRLNGSNVSMGAKPKIVHPLETLPYEIEYGIRRLIEQEISM